MKGKWELRWQNGTSVIKKYQKKDEGGKQVVEPHEILDWKSQKLDWYGQQTSPQGKLDFLTNGWLPFF